jgi:hypothetical protein
MVLECHPGKTVEVACRKFSEPASILGRLLQQQHRLCCNLKQAGD